MRTAEILTAAARWAEAGYTIFPEYGITDRMGARACACRAGADCASPGKHGVWARGLQEHGHDGATTDLDAFAAIVASAQSMGIAQHPRLLGRAWVALHSAEARRSRREQR